MGSLLRLKKSWIHDAAWGSVMKGVLGKTEYVVCAQSALCQIMETALLSVPDSECAASMLSDCALKASLRFLDMRMALGAAVLDTEVRALRAPSAPRAGFDATPGGPAPHPDADTVGRILRAVPADPITYSDLSNHLAHYRSDATGEKRRAVLCRMAELGLGAVKNSVARGAHAQNLTQVPVKFYRAPLTSQREELLRALRVPLSPWNANPAAEPALRMEGTGKRGYPSKRPAAAEDPDKARLEFVEFAQKVLRKPPADAAEVEKLMSAALRQVQVHGAALTVGATTRTCKRLPTWWQLRCQNCQHGTCEWAGKAVYDEATKTLTGSEIRGRSHGVAKRTDSARGRPLRSMQATPAKSITEPVRFTEEPTQEQLQQFVRKHFADRPLDESFCVACRALPLTKEGIGCAFVCTAHMDESTGCDCTWHGTARLRHAGTAEAQVILQYPPHDVHAAAEKLLYGTLTWRQQELARRSTEKSAAHVALDMEKLKSRSDPDKTLTPPQDAALEGFLKRQRRAERKEQEVAGEEPPRQTRRLDSSDFQYLVDRQNADLEGARTLELEDARIRPNDESLRAVHHVISRANVAVPLLCPDLIRRVLDRLPRPWQLKLSGDGTFRLLLVKDYAVKHWAQAGNDHVAAYRSQYIPMGFAIANQESEHNYTPLLQAWLHVCKLAAADFSEKDVLQLHGDLHAGLERARQVVLPNSTRLSDWAHVVGATSQGPSGLPGLIGKHIASEATRRFMSRWLYLSRCMPAFLFHIVWSCIVAQHTDLAAFWTACKKDYFCQEAGLRSAPWRCAPDRIAPGTAAGSSPQESWHGAKLKKLMTKRNLTPFELAQSLHQEVVLTYLRQLRNMERRGEHFQDWPDIATHLDQHILKGAKVMAKQGRTDAVNLLAWKKHRVWEDAQGNFFCLVPTSKWRPSRLEDRTPTFVERQPVQLQDSDVPTWAALCLAETLAQAESALQQLGIYEIYDPAQQAFTNVKRAAALFSDWRLVVLGPAACKIWKAHRLPDLPADANVHRFGLCFLCEHAAVAGPCEHLYVGLLARGDVKVEACPQKRPGRPSKKTRVSEPASAPGLGLSWATSRPPASARTSPAQPESSQCDSRMDELLCKTGLGHLREPFSAQGMSVPIFLDMSYADLRAFFGMAPSEIYRLKSAAQDCPQPAAAASASAIPASASAIPASASATPPKQRTLPWADSPTQAKVDPKYLALRQVYGRYPPK